MALSESRTFFFPRTLEIPGIPGPLKNPICPFKLLTVILIKFLISNHISSKKIKTRNLSQLKSFIYHEKNHDQSVFYLLQIKNEPYIEQNIDSNQISKLK